MDTLLAYLERVASAGALKVPLAELPAEQGKGAECGAR